MPFFANRNKTTEELSFQNDILWVKLASFK